MSSTATSKLGLFKAVINSGEPFRVSDFNSNMDKIDASSGAFICTSTTRPGAPFDGQLIKETDTKRFLVWDQSSADWVTISGRIVCTSTTRPANPGLSEEIFETDTKFVRMWTGTRWAFMGYKGDDDTNAPFGAYQRIGQAIAQTGATTAITGWSGAKVMPSFASVDGGSGKITINETGRYRMQIKMYSSAGASTVTTVFLAGASFIPGTETADTAWRGAGFAGAGDLNQSVNYEGFWEEGAELFINVRTKSSAGTGTHGVDVKFSLELVG